MRLGRSWFVFSLGALIARSYSLANDPAELLARAEKLADYYNWYDSHPLYAEAEKAFATQGDERSALFARVSRLRGEMQTLALPELVETIDSILATDNGKNDKRLRLRCLVVRGDVNLEIDAAAAKQDWEAALALANELQDPKWRSRAQGELGLAAFLLGDAAASRSYVGNALATAIATGDVGAQIRYYSAIATGLHLSGDHQQSLRYFDLALSTAGKHPDTGFQYVAYWGKAKALLALGRAAESEKMIHEALAQAEASDRRIKKVQMLLAAADIAQKRKRLDDAQRLLQQAQPIAEQGGFRRLLAEIYFDLATLHAEKAEYSDGARKAEVAIDLTEKVGDKYLLPGYLLLLANLRRAEGDRAQALAELERATDIIDGLLVNVPTPGHASSLINAMSTIYARHFEIAAERPENAEYAFQVLERARGRVLSDVISRAVGPRNRRSPAEARLERELSQLQRALLGQAGPTERSKTLQRIWEVEQAFLSAEVESVSWKGRRLEDVSLGDIRTGLRPNEALIEYVFANDAAFAFAISHQGVAIHKLGRRASVEADVRRYVEGLRAGAASDEMKRKLSAVLLAPLSQLTRLETVTVIADGPLHGFPFETLKPIAFGFAPSATAHYSLRKSRPDEGSRVAILAVGDVPYDGIGQRAPNPARTVGLFDARSKPRLEPLPASRTEVEKALAVFAPSAVGLLGADATEARFKKQPLENFEIIHLAVHGFADEKEPQRAALVLAQDKSEDEDGFLQPREIARLPLRAKIVVLSACNTAVGRQLGQEGVSNLARAFLMAGASSVLMTSWSVGDTVTAALMPELYRNLRAGQEVATALRDAKAAVIRKFGPSSVPTLAAFQIFGNGSVVISGGRK